jgi:hypothetical protein
MITSLLEIINTTIKNSIFPSYLKNSVVKPILKKGTDDEDIYHPIMLVPAMWMLLEKIVAKLLVSFLDKHNIINYSQFGFRKNKSTNDKKKIRGATGSDEPWAG